MSIIKVWCPPWWKRGPSHPGKWVAARCPLCVPREVLGALAGTGGLTRGHLRRLLSSPTRAPRDVRARPKSFSNPCLQPRGSQFCTCASGFRSSPRAALIPVAATRLRNKSYLMTHLGPLTGLFCSINNLVRWAELD